MAVIDSTTNVYDITRFTHASMISVQQYIDRTIGDTIDNYFGDEGDDGINGSDGTSYVGGWTLEELLEFLESWKTGFNFIVDDRSTEYTSWYLLALGLKSDWTEDIYSATGIVMQTVANDYYSKAEIGLFAFASYDDTTAYVDIQMNAYASAVEALAERTSLIEVTYQDITATLNESALVWAGDTDAITVYPTQPVPGELKEPYNSYVNTAALCALTDGYKTDPNYAGPEIGDVGLVRADPTAELLWYKFTGPGVVGTSGCGWIKTIDLKLQADVTTIGGAKSLYTDEFGNIVGWQYIGGTDIVDTFKVVADTFQIASGQVDGDGVPINPKPVFEVNTVTNQVEMNADVKILGTVDIGTVYGENVIGGGYHIDGFWSLTTEDLPPCRINPPRPGEGCLAVQEGDTTYDYILGRNIMFRDGKWTDIIRSPITVHWQLSDASYVTDYEFNGCESITYERKTGTTGSSNIGFKNYAVQIYRHASSVIAEATIGSREGVYTLVPGDTIEYDFYNTSTGLVASQRFYYDGPVKTFDSRVGGTNPEDMWATPAGICSIDAVGWLTNVKLHIHGDAVIDGTLTADALKADTITADKIKTNEITVGEIHSASLTHLWLGKAVAPYAVPGNNNLWVVHGNCDPARPEYADVMVESFYLPFETILTVSYSGWFSLVGTSTPSYVNIIITSVEGFNQTFPLATAGNSGTGGDGSIDQHLYGNFPLKVPRGTYTVKLYAFVHEGHCDHGGSPATGKFTNYTHTGMVNDKTYGKITMQTIPTR